MPSRQSDNAQQLEGEALYIAHESGDRLRQACSRLADVGIQGRRTRAGSLTFASSRVWT